MNNNGAKEIKFIYQLPYLEHKELCSLLDRNDRWEELCGEYMDFDVMTIYELRRYSQRGLSPAEELLHRWGHQLHTIEELFAILSKMHYYKAMMVLKPFVDQSYHHFIFEGEQFLDLSQRAKYLEEAKINKSNVEKLTDSSSGRVNAGEGATDSSKYDKDLQVDTNNLNLPSEPGRMRVRKVIHMSSAHLEVKILNTALAHTEQPADFSNERSDSITVEGSPPTSIPAESEPVPPPPESKNEHNRVSWVEGEAVFQDVNNFSSGEASIIGLPLLSTLGIKSENNIENSSNYASGVAVTENS